MSCANDIAFWLYSTGKPKGGVHRRCSKGEDLPAADATMHFFTRPDLLIVAVHCRPHAFSAQYVQHRVFGDGRRCRIHRAGNHLARAT